MAASLKPLILAIRSEFTYYGLPKSHLRSEPQLVAVPTQGVILPASVTRTMHPANFSDTTLGVTTSKEMIHIATNEWSVILDDVEPPRGATAGSNFGRSGATRASSGAPFRALLAKSPATSESQSANPLSSSQTAASISAKSSYRGFTSTPFLRSS